MLENRYVDVKDTKIPSATNQAPETISLQCMPDIPLDKASFVSLWLETLLYGTQAFLFSLRRTEVNAGAYGVLFGICVHILLYSRRAPGTTFNPLLWTAVAMFTMSTMHVCVGLVRGLTAFIGQENVPDGALAYFAEIWLWISIFKQALYATNNIVADGLVIYRCYIVWGSNFKVIVVPIIMLIATSVCGYLAGFNFSQVKPGEDVFVSNIAEWGTALFSLSLSTNIVVISLIAMTVLVAGRIYWIARTTRRLLGSSTSSRKYQNAVAIILESGAIYSVSLMTLLILYCLKTNAQYIVYDALAQIMGIAPTLIIVRVGLGVSTQHTTFALQTAGASTNASALRTPLRTK
ncbi:hypothetical protein MSAN_00747300 [Mycena sanguinolenta]|uniref:Uncharacterized protein n=1 Tax=Mycena sanguinolenta TaxID=230812 RepID=A0A8H6Z7A9_9AGAR|nr:hypothetical protein MSAN_00747300 [Mycena sanguinolenta]